MTFSIATIFHPSTYQGIIMAEFIKWINGAPCIREYFCWLNLVNQHPELSQEYLINSRKEK